MNQYPKIQSLYLRDERGKMLFGEFTRPEFQLIDRWLVTEKIDGTNIRLGFTREDGPDGKGMGVVIGGRTDNAQIPTKLLGCLNTMIEISKAGVASIMDEHDLDSITLYGEGYGAGIQSGGIYRQDQSFILFDVQVNDRIWLDWDAVQDTALRLGIDVVPSWQGWSLSGIKELVEGGFDNLSMGGDAEGIVARSPVPLYNQRGERVMFKLKAKDFK